MPRRYSRQTKTGVVIAAVASSVTAAAEQAGVPVKTASYWFNSPEFAELRAKTRDELAAESIGVAHRVLGEIVRRLPEFEPRDLSVLYGILIDKGQLLGGAATARIETKEIINSLDDHEREALRKIVAEAVSERELAETAVTG